MMKWIKRIWPRRFKSDNQQNQLDFFKKQKTIRLNNCLYFLESVAVTRKVGSGDNKVVIKLEYSRGDRQ